MFVLPPVLRKQKLPSGGCHFHKHVEQAPPGMADPRRGKDYLTDRWDKSFFLSLPLPSGQQWRRGADLSLVTSDRMGGNGMKLNQGKFRLDTGESFFTGEGGHWDRLPGMLWMTLLTVTVISFRYSCKDQGIELCGPYGSLSESQSMILSWSYSAVSWTPNQLCCVFMDVCYLTTNLHIPAGTTEVQQGLELFCLILIRQVLHSYYTVQLSNRLAQTTQ